MSNGKWEVQIIGISPEGQPQIISGTVIARRFEVNLAGALLFYNSELKHTSDGVTLPTEPIQAYASGRWISVNAGIPNN